MLFARSLDGGRTWVGRQDVSLAPTGTDNLFPAIAARHNGKGGLPGRTTGRASTPAATIRMRAGTPTTRRSLNGGQTWSTEVQLSQGAAGYPYKFADGYLEPYGDYFELDIDGAGQTHVLWGEGPSYDGPGNVWYSRE